jgi:predicted Ser/Thr protein kinase
VSERPPLRDERDALRARVEQAVGALFEIEEEIGRGGMAVVYRARDVRLRRKVALKVLPPELAFRDDVKRRFLREAQVAAQLSHPNIVPIYAVGELDGIVYFAMGLVEGDPLARLLASEPRPPVTVVRQLLREVAEALAYAHARGVVHRDVKPDNILVEQASGRALVSDFGIARAAEGDPRLTLTGNAVGTPAYMSPEQAMGDREVDGRSDLYSLGVVGYQMLAGELPFGATNTPAMLMKHISERPPPLHDVRTDLPANLVHAIERAMAKGRNERWPDASAFRDAVAENATVADVDSPSQDSRIGLHARVGEHAAFLGLRIAKEVEEGVLGSLGLYPPAPGDQPAKPAASNDPAAPYPRFPALPPNWMFRPDTKEYGREALREWRKQQRLWHDRNRERANAPAHMSRRELWRARRDGPLGPMTPEDRIRRVQRSIVSFATMSAFFAVINMITSPRFPWFLFPMLGMGIRVVFRISSLWVDGIPIRRIFQRQPYVDPSAAAASGTPAPFAPRAPAGPPRLAAADLAGVPRDVLDGTHGATVREAAEAKAIIADVLAKLTPADRQMLPEILPTVDALVARVRSLAQGLHQLDADASSEAITKLERRLADTRALGAGAPDGERRLQLLERQLATLKDLASRRETVAQQLESASMVLQTIRLDLIKLRSSGLDARLDASTGATQEARALSTDIGRVIEAANEVRKL